MTLSGRSSQPDNNSATTWIDPELQGQEGGRADSCSTLSQYTVRHSSTYAAEADLQRPVSGTLRRAQDTVIRRPSRSTFSSLHVGRRNT